MNVSKKKIKVFAVFSAANKIAPLSITSTHKEAMDVVEKTIFMNHFSHFLLWCNLRGLSPDFRSSQWYEYASNIFSSEEESCLSDQFQITELYYSIDDFASFMRMFTHCPIIDLPFERPEEMETFIIESGLYLTPVSRQSPQARERVSTLSKIDSHFIEKYNISMANCKTISSAKTREECESIIQDLDEKKEAEQNKKQPTKSTKRAKK